MAKGIRSKQKKRLRSEMRRTVGAAFERERLKETQEHLARRLAAAGESLSMLAKLRKKLGGASASEEDMEMEKPNRNEGEPEAETEGERNSNKTLVNHYSKMTIPGEESNKKGKSKTRSKKQSKKQVFKVAKRVKVARRSSKKSATA